MADQESKFHTLVVDSSAIIHHQQLHNIAHNVVTIAEVLKELKCQRSQLTLSLVPQDVHILTPSDQSIEHIRNFARRTGDLPSLSIVDIKVLALVYEMEKQYCEKNHIRKDPMIPKIVENAPKAENDAELKIPGFYSQRTAKTDPNEDWITPVNISEIHRDSKIPTIDGVKMDSQTVRVVCAVSDFAMQNVLLHMGLHVVSIEGYFISRIRSYTMKCTTCSLIEPDVTKEFCTNCGYRTLKKISYTLSSNGGILCPKHPKPPKKQDISKFSTNNSIRKYGAPISNEEQLRHYKHTRRTKASKYSTDTPVVGMFGSINPHSMFSNNDTTSRSFQKGYHLRKNRL